MARFFLQVTRINPEMHHPRRCTIRVRALYRSSENELGLGLGLQAAIRESKP